MAQENCWRGWLRINARHQELHRPWQHLRKQQPNDRRLQTVNHWTITHGHVIRRKCRPKLYNLILWYLFSYTCFFMKKRRNPFNFVFSPVLIYTSNFENRYTIFMTCWWCYYGMHFKIVLMHRMVWYALSLLCWRHKTTYM